MARGDYYDELGIGCVVIVAVFLLCVCVVCAVAAM